MPMLFYETESDTRGRVMLIHYMPEQLTEEERSKGISVDIVPDPPQPVKGKSHVLYVNPQTGETWYEQVDRLLTQEEQMEDLRSQNLDLMAAIADMAVKLGVI
ncbi:MAG: hypothetical protein HPY71_01765 [Firmicutes bacterium]|nr:hypothetical protein [Bacillota bacterium]